MSQTQPCRRLKTWVAVGVPTVAALIALQQWSMGLVREQRWASIRAAAEAERWSELEPSLQRWLDDNPDDTRAWLMLGSLLFDQGREAEARPALRRVREGDEGWSHAQTLLAELSIRRHDLADAEQVLRRAAERDRRAIEPRERLVHILVLERRPAEAYEVLRELYRLDRDPRRLADCLLVSRIETDLRDLGPEIESYHSQTPHDPWLRRAWGLYLLSHERSAEALDHLEFAASAFRDDPMGRFALAECQMALGVLREDLSVLGEEPSRGAEASRWWVIRAQMEEAWGRADDAFESLRRAVAADPRNQEAQHRIGRAMIHRGDTAGARPHLDLATSLRDAQEGLRRELEHLHSEGYDAGRLERIGRLCLEASRPAAAREWFDLAIRHGARSAALRLEIERLPPGNDDPPAILSRPVLASSAPPGPLSSPIPLAARASSELGPRFEDIAERAEVRYQYDCGATDNLFIADTMGGGVGLFDFDNDGWLDLYFVNGCALPYDRESPPRPNKLYRNRGDGTFEDVTERAGVAGRGYGMGCTVGDYDNDGHDDLFVTGLSETILYHNRGDGTFEDVTRRAGVFSSRWTTAAGFADLDGDGDLDLVVVTYVDADPGRVRNCRDEFRKPIHCPPETFPAQLDHLFRNDGDGKFTDVSKAAGIEVHDGSGLGLAIADFDDDGRLDFFVANDGAANFLFRNLGGLRFEEVGITAGAAYNGMGQATASMGVVADDLNGDGRIDLFHTNFVNQTNTLRWNLGGGLFTDGTLAANLTAPSRSKTGFGTVACDIDNDGHLDLFVANGHTDDQPWFNTPMAQTAQLFLGQEKGRFEPAGPEVAPYLSRPVVGRGVAAGDLDNDGLVDLVVVHRDAPAAILRNRSRGGHWLGLRLRGDRSGSTPVGSRVTCRAGGRTSVRRLTSGTGYLSSSDARPWFGLGPAETVEWLEIRWPSGTVQEWSGLPVDRLLELREGDNTARDITHMK